MNKCLKLCGGIYSNNFTTNFPHNICAGKKIDNRLIFGKSLQLTFFGPPSQISVTAFIAIKTYISKIYNTPATHTITARGFCQKYKTNKAI